MNLMESQRRIYEAITTPLTGSERMQEVSRRGSSNRVIAHDIIKPGDRLTAFERLEIYNRQYWYRLLSGFNEDFQGLRAVVGKRRFDALAQAYLADCGSRSFTLRNLGSNLEAWLQVHSEWTHPWQQLALDMVRLEWADIEVFDAADESPMALGDLQELNESSALRLQPYIRLLSLAYPVDEMLLAIRQDGRAEHDQASNATLQPRGRQHVRRIIRRPQAPAFLVVHRSDFSVYFKRVPAEAYKLLRRLHEGARLAEALEATFQNSSLSDGQTSQVISAWFREWASYGWFCRPAGSLGGNE
jgi:Putative DNA-binding domain